MFICILIGTVLFAVFAFLFMTAGKEVSQELYNCLCANEIEKQKVLKIEMGLIAEKIREMTANTALRRDPDPDLIKRGQKLKKKFDASAKLLKTYQSQGVSILDLPPIAGYRIILMLGIDQNVPFIADLFKKCLQFKEKQEASSYAYYIAASLIGNILLGTSLLFVGIGFGLGMGMGTKALVVGLVVFAACALLGYIPYDNVNNTIAKRTAEIDRDFPRVVSKMTLLIISDIPVMQAWELVAKSGTTTLYNEMQRTVIEIAHNVKHVDAYTNFIKRCNNAYATKLGTAIMQNYSKGNSEIADLMRELNKESWSEYKHTARRKGESISTQLLIPTLLLFAGIIGWRRLNKANR